MPQVELLLMVLPQVGPLLASIDGFVAVAVQLCWLWSAEATDSPLRAWAEGLPIELDTPLYWSADQLKVML